MARLDFHALNVVTHDLHWGNSICGNNHKLVKIFTITSPLITVLNKKFSLALYHALYFISFIATALLSSHSQCPCQRQL